MPFARHGATRVISWPRSRKWVLSCGESLWAAFVVEACGVDAVPEEREGGALVGGHLDGCRLGFDLGASDYKVAAVRDGEVIYSDEFAWDPRPQTDPQYHYDHLNAGLRAAASTARASRAPATAWVCRKLNIRRWNAPPQSLRNRA